MTGGHRARFGIAFALAITFALPVPVAGQAVEDGRPRGETGLPLPRYVSLRAGVANARRGPGKKYRIDWEFVRHGLPLQVTAEYGHWRRVRDADGAGGWVHQALLSGTRTALVRSDAPVPLYGGPDDARAPVAMAEPGAVARLSACKGDWCELDSDGIKGWLPRAAIWGVGPQEDLD
jgi:SH3-like domain-containing protein